MMGKFSVSFRHRLGSKSRKSRSLDIPSEFNHDADSLDKYREKDVLKRRTSFTPGCTSVLISSRSPFEEFHRLFPSLPAEEFPLNVYTCALSKDILLQGKLFVSHNWLCFYSNIFGYETKVKIEMNRITAINREKTAFVVPNAISIQTPNKRFFFCSFLSRETVFRLISRTWKDATTIQDSTDKIIDQTELGKADCNDNDTTASIFDISAGEPRAVCSDIDEVKTSTPVSADDDLNLFPSTVHVNNLQKRNGFNRVSITTKPETKMIRWNTIADLREIKPAKRRKKQLQFKEEGYTLSLKNPRSESRQLRILRVMMNWMQASKRSCGCIFDDLYRRFNTVSALFYFILLIIIILGLMSVFLMYKINSLNQTFLERKDYLLPQCSAQNEEEIATTLYGKRMQRVNNILSTNLNAVYKAHDALRKLKEDLDS